MPWARFPGFLIGLLLALVLALGARAEVAVPVLQARVTDLTGTLAEAQKSGLDGDLRALETSTGAQVAILIVASTKPEAIEQYSIRVVEAWKLGRKGKDDGVLVLVAKNDRKLRIEVGYGLEGVIPDAVAKRIIDEAITPRFKQGDFFGGLQAGIARIAAAIEAKPVPEKLAEPAAPAEPGDPRIPDHPWAIMDQTGTLDPDAALALRDELDRFYMSDDGRDRTKPVFFLIVPNTGGEPIDRFAARALALWGEKDNLDVDRSLLLVIARDEGRAHIATGAGLSQRIPAGAAEQLVAEIIEPGLRSGELLPTLQKAAQEVEGLIDAAAANRNLEERVFDELASVPVWLIVALIVIGTGIRWFLGPLFGALVMAGVVGSGAWFVAGLVEVALAAAAIAFLFVLVGLSNWVSMALSVGSGGSGGGGGFSGGGGGFGGGGASGSW